MAFNLDSLVQKIDNKLQESLEQNTDKEPLLKRINGLCNSKISHYILIPVAAFAITFSIYQFAKIDVYLRVLPALQSSCRASHKP